MPAGEPDDGPDDAHDDDLDDVDGDADGDADEVTGAGAAGEEPPVPRGPFTRDNPLTFIVPEPLLLRIERVDREGAAPGGLGFSCVGQRPKSSR